MSNFVDIEDFRIGRERIAFNVHTAPALQEYIDRYEREYIYKTFGVTLGDLIIATPENYDDYILPFAIEVNGCVLVSDGLKEALKGIIYFYYVRDQFSQQTTVGVKQTESENSKNVSTLFHDLYTRYNNGIDTLKVIRERMDDDGTDYTGTQLNYVINL